MWHAAFCVLLIISTSHAQQPATSIPAPPGKLIDIGGQNLHVYCTGTGSPTVLLESGTGDLSVIWSLVQPGVSAFTRVCSYDRGGYAWSDPGTRPRTFAQLALELHTALQRLGVTKPYVLVGQSYGGQVIRGFAARYPREVSGMVLVDAAPEDHRVVYGGDVHRIRDSAKGRRFPQPHIGLDTELLKQARAISTPASDEALPAPLDRLPEAAQRIWRWANAQPLLELARSAELEWSPEELARMHDDRLKNRATLGDLPLIVLARAQGGYADGMSISAADLEKERRELQADLARLSRKGRLVFVNSGHNIHLEEPDVVIRSIREIVEDNRTAAAGVAQSSSTSNVETLRLTSKLFNNTRTIRVLIPSDYHDPENATKRYPVFYFNDGVIVFKADRINVEGIIYKLIASGEVPPMIAVGIDNGGSTDKTKNAATDRANEYLPYPDVGFGGDHAYAPDPPEPQGKLYPEFLVNEVMPVINARYRTKTGPANTGLGGISYGGVAALYAALSRPNVFGKLMLESTPLWIGPDKQLLKDARKASKWPATIYIAYGTNESPDAAINAEGKQDTYSLRDIIAARSPKTVLKIIAEEGAKHEPSAWRGRLPEAMRFLFRNSQDN